MTAMSPSVKFESASNFVPLYKPTLTHRLRVVANRLRGRHTGV